MFIGLTDIVPLNLKSKKINYSIKRKTNMHVKLKILLFFFCEDAVIKKNGIPFALCMI